MLLCTEDTDKFYKMEISRILYISRKTYSMKLAFMEDGSFVFKKREY
jgi:hypothetical protein